jgi:ABC-type sugar transport system ATPase subunit
VPDDKDDNEEVIKTGWLGTVHSATKAIRYAMVDRDLRDQIAGIETDIDELAKTLDGCRKAMLFSKVAIAAGGIWILANLLGAIRFEPATTIGAIAAIIGGVVVFGSNSSTSKQTTAAMKAAETRRAELIDMIDLRTVGANGGGLWEPEMQLDFVAVDVFTISSLAAIP